MCSNQLSYVASDCLLPSQEVARIMRIWRWVVNPFFNTFVQLPNICALALEIQSKAALKGGY